VRWWVNGRAGLPAETHYPFSLSHPPSAIAAFTLLELLIVIGIIALLAGLLLPSLTRSKHFAQRLKCVSNLHQLGLAAQMYWDDHAGSCFRYSPGSTNRGTLYWFGWLDSGAEGQRSFDATAGALYPYLQGRGVELCPSLNYAMAQFKLKASGAAYGYGYNLNLSAAPPFKVSKLVRSSDTALFADAAQVNDFQPPASRTNPMLEEWYYVDNTINYPNGHFRHSRRANVVFCDGHVAMEKMVDGSLDQKLPRQNVGRLRAEILSPP
jgi:prepilin-type processing-associated H-X9-DG protein